MKRPPPETVPGIPEAQPLRLRMVGTAIFERGWRVPLASGIGMSRRNLYYILDGKRSIDPTQVDVRLLHLITHERLQSERRVRALRKLQNKLLAHIEYVEAAKIAYGKD
ncbi:hypothetical protein [Bradyrhizobium australafricanum]|uniref:hypothetical protein n=1 Tax=Bradyrhizobium australafricanum TaxID=2821406 RepID=UPI001CE2D9D8|nr:hypothetical protein [Bradyrhizobium australafricanum]MCA6098149.1 hypothetical protein [Bradyrhizobium australafricanum]